MGQGKRIGLDLALQGAWFQDPPHPLFFIGNGCFKPYKIADLDRS